MFENWIQTNPDMLWSKGSYQLAKLAYEEGVKQGAKTVSEAYEAGFAEGKSSVKDNGEWILDLVKFIEFQQDQRDRGRFCG